MEDKETLDELINEVVIENREELKEVLLLNVKEGIKSSLTNSWSSPIKKHIDDAIAKSMEEILPESKILEILRGQKDAMVDKIKTGCDCIGLHLALSMLKTVQNKLSSDWERNTFFNQMFKDD